MHELLAIAWPIVRLAIVLAGFALVFILAINTAEDSRNVWHCSAATDHSTRRAQVPRHDRGEVWRSAANRHLELLKRLLTLATQWGAILFSPPREVPKFGKADGAGPRERYATETEFAAVYARASATSCASRNGYRANHWATSRKPSALSRKNDTKEGLKVKALRGGKWLLFKWTPELRAAIDRGYSLWPRKYPTPIDQPILVAKGRRPLLATGSGRDSPLHATLR